MQPKNWKRCSTKPIENKVAAKNPIPKLFLVSVLLQLSSITLSAQTVNTISNGILHLQVISEHLDFCHRDQDFRVKVAYQKYQDTSFQFKQQFIKKFITITFHPINPG
jgi:hypothetical protein